MNHPKNLMKMSSGPSLDAMPHTYMCDIFEYKTCHRQLTRVIKHYEFAATKVYIDAKDIESLMVPLHSIDL